MIHKTRLSVKPDFSKSGLFWGNSVPWSLNSLQSICQTERLLLSLKFICEHSSLLLLWTWVSFQCMSNLSHCTCCVIKIWAHIVSSIYTVFQSTCVFRCAAIKVKLIINFDPWLWLQSKTHFQHLFSKKQTPRKRRADSQSEGISIIFSPYGDSCVSCTNQVT